MTGAVTPFPENAVLSHVSTPTMEASAGSRPSKASVLVVVKFAKVSLNTFTTISLTWNVVNGPAVFGSVKISAIIVSFKIGGGQETPTQTP
jgi:hypothetical protein